MVAFLLGVALALLGLYYGEFYLVAIAVIIASMGMGGKGDGE